MSSKTDVLLPGVHFDFILWMCFHSLESNIWHSLLVYGPWMKRCFLFKKGIPTSHVASTYLPHLSPCFHVIPMGELPVPSFASQRNPGVSVPPEASKVPEVCITGMKKKHSLARNSPFHWIGSRWYQMVDVQLIGWITGDGFQIHWNHPEWVYQNVPKLYI